MSARTNGAGVGCCGNCGHELVVACLGGCAEPDIVFREESHIQTRARRRLTEKRVKVTDVPKGYCTYQYGCDQPVAPCTYHGRPTTKCEKHLALVQKYEASRRAREVVGV
jgi:hypothetical protein